MSTIYQNYWGDYVHRTYNFKYTQHPVVDQNIILTFIFFAVQYT